MFCLSFWKISKVFCYFETPVVLRTELLRNYVALSLKPKILERINLILNRKTQINIETKLKSPILTVLAKKSLFRSHQFIKYD